MRLVVKFNLVLLVIFALGFAAAAAVSASLLERSAREDVLQDARLIMESALATRAYTINQVAPLLKKLGDAEFLPQTVPAFAATEQFGPCTPSCRTSPTRRPPSIRRICGIAPPIGRSTSSIRSASRRSARKSSESERRRSGVRCTWAARSSFGTRLASHATARWRQHRSR
jgi:hypothetical protein